MCVTDLAGVQVSGNHLGDGRLIVGKRCEGGDASVDISERLLGEEAVWPIFTTSNPGLVVIEKRHLSVTDPGLHLADPIYRRTRAQIDTSGHPWFGRRCRRRSSGTASPWLELADHYPLERS